MGETLGESLVRAEGFKTSAFLERYAVARGVSFPGNKTPGKCPICYVVKLVQQ